MPEFDFSARDVIYLDPTMRADAPGENPPGARKKPKANNPRVIKDLVAALEILRKAPSWNKVVGYDEMRYDTMLLKSIPWSEEEFQSRRPIQDHDIVLAQEWLQTNGLRGIGKSTVSDAVETLARENRFHPIRDYLNSVSWDQTIRLPKFFQTYLGAEDNEYVSLVGPMFFIQMVSRIYEPGCQADYQLILEGFQGVLKSTFLRTLAGEEYFSDAMPTQLQSRETSQHLRGKWLIEMPELGQILSSKNSSEDAKGFLTRREEIYLPRYGRNEAHEKRQCVFVGTTNSEAYFRDATGNRRYWPVEVTKIDLPELISHRDQLFAEAVSRYHNKERPYPTKTETELYFIPQQDARYEIDAWEDIIGKYLLLAPDKLRFKLYFLAQEALGLKFERLGTQQSRRITPILRRLGCELEKKEKGNWWVAPEREELRKKVGKISEDTEVERDMEFIKKNSGKPKGATGQAGNGSSGSGGSSVPPVLTH